MDRIIEVKVFGNHLTKDSKTAGTRGEANITNLRITFDKAWDAYEKKIVFWDAYGENAVRIMLTVNLLENREQSTLIYLVPIPAEAMARAGMLKFTIIGSLENKKQASATGELKVEDSGIILDPIPPTPDEIAQMQSEVEAIKGDIQKTLKEADSIKNMSVSSETLKADMPAFVKKTKKDEVVNLHFGLPVGKSAYEIAVDNGYEGTEADWNNAVNEARLAAEKSASDALDKSKDATQSAKDAKESSENASQSAELAQKAAKDALEKVTVIQLGEITTQEQLDELIRLDDGWAKFNTKYKLSVNSDYFYKIILGKENYNAYVSEYKVHTIKAANGTFTQHFYAAFNDVENPTFYRYGQVTVSSFGDRAESVFGCAIDFDSVHDLVFQKGAPKITSPDTLEIEAPEGVTLQGGVLNTYSEANQWGEQTFLGDVKFPKASKPWFGATPKIGGTSYNDPNAEDVRNVEVDEETQKVYVKVKNERAAELAVKTYYNTYGVAIDLTNSDPTSAVTYTDDAVGMVAGSSDWDSKNIFRDIRPCMFKNGAVTKYLNPNDFTKYEDGTAADITSGAEGDVMIEIPKIGVKIATSDNVLTVQVTNDPKAEGFSYYAHTRETEGDREKLYIGAFLGYNASSKLRSLSGKKPTAYLTIGKTRTLAQANGDGYDQIAFYQLTLLQCLFLIKYKSRNSQTALGMGYVNGDDVTKTGGTVARGMDFGEITGQQQMKFLGIEDFWGNLYCWIDGLVSSSDYHALTATDNFNDTGDGYTDQGALGTSYIGSYIKAPQGTNELGFIIKQRDGSATTYFADSASFDAGFVPAFGGCFDVSSYAGAFSLYVTRDAAYASDVDSGRLMYL